MMLLAGGQDLVHYEYQTINQFARVRLLSALIKKSEQMSNEMLKKSKSHKCQISQNTKWFLCALQKTFKSN